jgi:hypothetical protein
MPLVFVHGVSTRKGGDYQDNEKVRNSMFRRFAFTTVFKNPQRVRIESPYWGDHGARFAWGLASIPAGDYEGLGAEEEVPVEVLAQIPEGAAENQVLVDVARTRSLEEAIDLLWAAYAPKADQREAEEAADLAVRAVGYARQYPSPVWLGQVRNDDAFMSELAAAVEEWTPDTGTSIGPDIQNWEALGGFGDVWDRLQETKDRITSAPGRLASTPIIRLARPPLTRMLATFTGDVFSYLAERGTPQAPGPIVKDVLAGLDAAQTSAVDEKLVVVAHSMGGNIMYDILSYFRPELRVDALVTVGSQVSLFEELKLFGLRTLDVQGPDGRVAKPNNLGLWINVFDRNDVLGFAVRDVFEGVTDYSYSTGAALLTHGLYFALPSFHDRLGERLREAGL